MSRLILASAAKFEIAPLIESLTSIGLNATCINTGIGLTESSIISSRLRDLVSGRDVVFCCTAGVIGSFSDTQLYLAKSVELAPFDVRNGDTYLLKNFEPTLIFNSLPINLPARRIYGSLGVSKQKETSPEFVEALETIELYGVARSWLPVVKSFTAIVASTNATGPQAHDQWVENFDTASRLTAEFLVAQLPTLGF